MEPILKPLKSVVLTPLSGAFRMFTQAVKLFAALAVLSEGAAKIDPVCADGRCGKDFIAEFIGGNRFKAAGGDLENVSGSLVGPGVDPLAGDDGGRGKTLTDPRLPFFFAGFRLPAIADSAVSARVEVAAEGQHAGYVGPDRFFPDKLLGVSRIHADCQVVGVATTG